MALGAVSLNEKRIVRRRSGAQGILQMAIHATIRRALIDTAPVAGVAIQGPVNASQRKSRHRMLELGTSPELLPMAFPAVRKPAVMHVILLMTEQAVLAHAAQALSALVAFRTLQ